MDPKPSTDSIFVLELELQVTVIEFLRLVATYLNLSSMATGSSILVVQMGQQVSTDFKLAG